MRKGLLLAAAIASALGLSLAFLSTLIDSNFVYYWIALSRLLVLLLAAAIIVGLVFLTTRAKPITQLASRLAKRENLYLLGFFAGLILLQLFIYRFIAITQNGWDNETVFRAAGLAAEGHLTEGLRHYLTQFPNNFGITLLMGSWFNLTSWLPVGWTVRALALNILFVNISILLVYASVRALRGTAAAIKSSWLALLFSPFFLYLPLFYTDTLSMPFAIGLVCAYIYLKCAETPLHKCILAATMGLLAVFAFALKPTSLIILIAILIYELLTLPKPRLAALKNTLKLPVIFLAVALPGVALFTTAQNMVALEGVEPLPWQEYVKMGAQGEGGFYRPDRNLALDRLNREGFSSSRAGQLAWVEYRARVVRFGPLGYANFLVHKLSYTWGDGTFYAPNKLERSPISAETGDGSKTWLQQIVLPEGRFFTAFLYLQNGFWLACLFLFAFSAWRGISKASTAPGAPLTVENVKLILRLTLLGVILFFLFWETRSRYIVNYTPIFLLLLALELHDLRHLIKIKRRSK
ncbi:hypothetical protein FWG86_02120 [Candidatus Saccharibacteria bacterium]|nr:hypothetical protein [Candidatus Saccharibacteria bacterium]